MGMDRRDFLIGASFAVLGAAAKTKLWAQTPADVRLEIAPLKLEIAPRKGDSYSCVQRERSRASDSLAGRQADHD